MPRKEDFDPVQAPLFPECSLSGADVHDDDVRAGGAVTRGQVDDAVNRELAGLVVHGQAQLPPAFGSQGAAGPDAVISREMVKVEAFRLRDGVQRPVADQVEPEDGDADAVGRKPCVALDTWKEPNRVRERLQLSEEFLVKPANGADFVIGVTGEGFER